MFDGDRVQAMDIAYITIQNAIFSRPVDCDNRDRKFRQAPANRMADKSGRPTNENFALRHLHIPVQNY